MKKIYDKSEIWFAVMWIIIHVVGVSITDSLSESIGIPHLITLFFSIAMILVLLSFMKKNGLMEKYGLCKLDGSCKEFLYFIPLLAICTVNFWNGLSIEPSVGESVLTAATKGMVGIAEELIFRGLLFVCMCKTNVKSAIVVSSLTFGIGHIVNLLNGAPLFDTSCQIIYACAIGLCFTLVFKTGKSIIPCLLTHFVINASSAFGALPEDSQTFQIIVTVFLAVISIGYSLYLIVKYKDRIMSN